MKTLNRAGYPDYEAYRRAADAGKDVRGRVIPDEDAKVSQGIVAGIVTKKRKAAEKKAMSKGPVNVMKAKTKGKRVPFIKAGGEKIVGGVDMKMDAIKMREMTKKRK